MRQKHVKISMVATVERRLPGLVPNGGGITIRELLNHASGLFDYVEDKMFERQVDNPTKVWAPRRLVAIATAHAALFPPARGGRTRTPTTSCSA